MTADIRTAARLRYPGDTAELKWSSRDVRDAVDWAAARVTPTREQIEDVLTARADQSDETGTTIKLDDARDAMLALIENLATR